MFKISPSIVNLCLFTIGGMKNQSILFNKINTSSKKEIYIRITESYCCDIVSYMIIIIEMIIIEKLHLQFKKRSIYLSVTKIVGEIKFVHPFLTRNTEEDE